MNKRNANLSFSYVNDALHSDTSNKRKVIRMTTDGFYMAIVSEENGLEQLFQYSFLSDLSFKDKIAAITDVEKEKNIPCANNLFRLYTKYNVQIPEDFHDESKNEVILSVMVNQHEQYIPFEEKVDKWQLYNVSAWEKELYVEVKNQLSNYSLSTVATSLLNIIAKQQKETNALVFVEHNHFTVVAIDKQKLTGMNTFPFYTEKDFLYYCYAFLRKRIVDINSLSLRLCGNIAKQSSLYNAISKYCQDVDMLSNEGNAINSNYSYYCDLFE
ncbi:MAG: DUF3822 family protein [Bacteroidales bacterium]|jgi:hypothetical protein|nr:DUF3822 family protein [Bacteroidales bacterium]